jgi:hypothetical protein
MRPDEINEFHFVPFYDAAWELCRIGVLRPGEYAARWNECHSRLQG